MSEEDGKGAATEKERSSPKRGAAEAQGGKVWFERESGKGTTFFVEVPLTAITDQPLAKTVALG